MINQWIDGLDDDARDRIITAQEWCAGEYRERDARCLVSHVYGDDGMRKLSNERFLSDAKVALRFDRLALRRGLATAVVMCKRRAGAPAIVVPEPVRSEQTV